MGWQVTPVRQSAKARLHSRILHGFCKEGVLIIVIMTARLPRKANMAEGPLTAARRMLFMKVAVSFLCIPIQLGSPQMIISLVAISSSANFIGRFSIDWTQELQMSKYQAICKLCANCPSVKWKRGWRRPCAYKWLWGFYQNKATANLASTQRPGYFAYNCSYVALQQQATHDALGPVVQRPTSAQPSVKFNRRFFFFCSKAFSPIIFSVISESIQ